MEIGDWSGKIGDWSLGARRFFDSRRGVADRRRGFRDSVSSDDKKSLLVTLGLPEEVAAAAVATDGSKGYKASKTRTALFYTLKVNADAKAEWKQHFATYTAEAKASKGHVNVSHSYNEATREVICVDVLAGKDAMSNQIGNCFPAYARMLGAR